MEKQTEQTKYEVTRDGKSLFEGTNSECFSWLLQHQSCSVDHATKNEGYAITPKASQPEPTINWTEVGAEYTQDRAKIEAIISRMTWDYDFKGKRVAMMPGMGVQAAIKEYKMPNVSAIAIDSHELAPYGFYGVEANYSNAKVRAFFLDDGCGLTPLCTYVWPIAKMEN